jgi:hypothetical protein
MSKTLKKLFAANLILLFVTTPLAVFALGGVPSEPDLEDVVPIGGSSGNPGGGAVSNPDSGGIQNPLGEKGPQNISSLLVNITQWMLGFVGLLAMLALVWGSIMYITAFVDEAQTQKAKKIITWAIIGLVIAASSIAIITMVQNNILGITPSST